MRYSREPAFCPTCGYPMMPLPIARSKMHTFLCVFDGVLTMRDTRCDVTLNIPGYFAMQADLLKTPNLKVKEGAIIA